MKTESTHPMMDVREAIRIVLRETAARLLLSTAAKNTTEILPVNDTTNKLLGRVVAEEVRMREPGYPPYAASIMDGFAIRHDSISSEDTSDNQKEEEEEKWTHTVVSKVFAGDDDTKTNTEETNTDPSTTLLLPAAYYVTTGAVIPDGCDCVVPIEQVVFSEETDETTKIRILNVPKNHKKWIRQPGCDMAPGEIVLPKGHRIDAIALGLLLQSGVTQVAVVVKHQQPRITVGVLSTGNELLVSTDKNNNNRSQKDDDWWKNLQKGMIPDVNRPILMALLSSFSFSSGKSSEHAIRVVDLGLVRDDSAEAIVEKLLVDAKDCNVIITTGGISMGETDIMEDVLMNRLAPAHDNGDDGAIRRSSKLHFGRLNMKPGKPTTFITVDHCTNGSNEQQLVFCMPGNPVSAVVCTHLLVRPCLDLLVRGGTSNEKDPQLNDLDTVVENAFVHAELQATLAHDIPLDFERPEYHRVTLSISSSQDSSGFVVATSTGVQRSSRLQSLRDAEGLLVLPQATTQHPVAKAKCETYTVLLLNDNNRSVAAQVRVRDSMHMKGGNGKLKLQHQQLQQQPKRAATLNIGIVQVVDAVGSDAVLDESTLSSRVQKALSGSKSGTASVSSCRVYSDYTERFLDSDKDDHSLGGGVDVLVVVCPKFPGWFCHHAKLATVLRKKLIKVADTMALQARRGVASQDPASAVFEVIVGYRPPPSPSSDDGCIVILLPEAGLDEGLSNVRGILKHALNVARGKRHNHHHHHQQ